MKIKNPVRDRTIVPVLAGTNFQYQQWLRKQPRSPETNYRYACSPQAFCGTRFEKYIVVGTFWNRPDAREIYDAILVRLLYRSRLENRRLDHYEAGTVSLKENLSE